nr:immunoglobulin light chain junction region [Macaca mulatta]MOX83185.1 immunoglobulin light chain junction region [Macaca mulatta]MOX83636.1 immunoglobulin light chain junction region [Macaca mulatta]MOX83893.1 immunoglobulin light chain junction region [Macaca mulatta]
DYYCSSFTTINTWIF